MTFGNETRLSFRLAGGSNSGPAKHYESNLFLL